MTSPHVLTIDSLVTQIYESQDNLSHGAAQIGQKYIDKVLENQAEATIILATGNSQLQFLDILIASQKIDWSRINLLHLDEYLGIEGDNSASFRFYLHERVEKRIHPKSFNYLIGDALEPIEECDRYTKLLKQYPIDLCCLGVGINGHLAFNEPQVANFDDPHWVKIVQLDQQTRWVQVRQGHFKTFEQVPQYALTVTIPTILSSKKIICLAPGENKAETIKQMLQGAISPECPASILRQHSDTTLFLDEKSAKLL
ncbi:glucosamine-6-P isomerase [Crocosphaera subtropica ATCC 51142]|uniref:Glucosamine-6-P isomerase n=1 Tax=Crocosphaera subtropica (strain ATCC 51142 / BH68) TaxID=43989 RepID=B1WVU4_CROS5|nr:glucosamine-6-phosphate deaminase [Crocosphaera subtropica]ACB50681.1 glucosamine-6-P isomerase [Crocosphaera subtropica ATCC 51142]